VAEAAAVGFFPGVLGSLERLMREEDGEEDVGVTTAHHHAHPHGISPPPPPPLPTVVAAEQSSASSSVYSVPAPPLRLDADVGVCGGQCEGAVGAGEAGEAVGRG
jgi:hypothetical protein